MLSYASDVSKTWRHRLKNTSSRNFNCLPGINKCIKISPDKASRVSRYIGRIEGEMAMSVKANVSECYKNLMIITPIPS